MFRITRNRVEKWVTPLRTPEEYDLELLPITK
jgi:hypothetical protein